MKLKNPTNVVFHNIYLFEKSTNIWKLSAKLSAHIAFCWNSRFQYSGVSAKLVQTVFNEILREINPANNVYPTFNYLLWPSFYCRKTTFLLQQDISGRSALGHHGECFSAGPYKYKQTFFKNIPSNLAIFSRHLWSLALSAWSGQEGRLPPPLAATFTSSSRMRRGFRNS